jgi:hypothetical protein
VDPVFNGDYSFLFLMMDVTTMPLRIGLIGASRHGSRYIQHLLHDLPRVSLAALCRKRIGERLPSPMPLKRTARRPLPGAMVSGHRGGRRLLPFGTDWRGQRQRLFVARVDLNNESEAEVKAKAE